MSQTKFKPPWSSFAGFRKKMASALKKAGAPEQIVFEAGYIDCEDANVAADLFQAYEGIECEIKDYERIKKKNPEFEEDEKETWEFAIDSYIHDCVIEMCSTYSNLWNYAPGHKPVPHDAKKLANDVTKIMIDDLD
ncbi:hypothetical protein C4577_02955 [Candidatus Parcubacteria bacterium]|nr:MAG: hypothetical protein C4577_02955 [Candidatus Parcubacteria bacterium]